jgi:fucose permease
MFGRTSLLLISAITLILAFTVVRSTVPQKVSRVGNVEKPVSQAHLGATATGFYMVLTFLLLGIALRSLVNMNLQNYIPKQQQELGVSPAIYGLVMSAFLFASSVGGLAGSFAADKLGLRRVLAVSMILAGVSLYGFTLTQGVWSYACLGLTGLFIGPSHTLFVVAGQRRYPERMATMTGLFLGFTFVSGSVGAWLLGLLADRVGLSFTLGLLPWALAGAALCALFGVPEPKAQLVESESPAPA